MGLHIVQIGVGRVGRLIIYNIMSTGLADKITLCDEKPGLAEAFAEELYHAADSLGLDVEIEGKMKDTCVKEANIILVSAGQPRLPGVEMSRVDLAARNARIIKHIAESIGPHNPKAKYIIITNPVDAMAMIFKKYSGAEFVISTGTNLETIRLRSKLARTLIVPASRVRGWVGGEHGDMAVILWSTMKIGNISAEEYARSKGIAFSRDEMESYMKNVAKFVIDNLGATEYGPAASFREIVKAIAKNTRKILPVAAPMKFKEIPEPVHVSVPLRLGSSIGPTLFENLIEEEKREIEKAANAIYETYRKAMEEIS